MNNPTGHRGHKCLIQGKKGMRMIRWTAALVLFVQPAFGFGDSCSSFNDFQFNPRELERCIKEMKSLNDLRLQTLEIENQTLHSQVCDLAIEVDKINPSANIGRISCIGASAPKRSPPKPPAKPQTSSPAR